MCRMDDPFSDSTTGSYRFVPSGALKSLACRREAAAMFLARFIMALRADDVFCSSTVMPSHLKSSKKGSSK